MSNRKTAIARASSEPASPNVGEFLSELTALCERHGIGIAGAPTLFVMEQVDKSLRYGVDDESNLIMI